MIPAFQIAQAAFPGGGAPPVTHATFDPARLTTGIALSGGNLVATASDSSAAPATNPVDAATANHYAEITWTSKAAVGGYAMIGLLRDDDPLNSGSFPGSHANSYGVEHDGDTFKNGTHGYSGGVTFAVGDTVKIWLHAGSIYFAKVGAAFGTAFDTGLTGNWSPACGGNQGYGIDRVFTANFGASAWLDTPPAGAVGW